MFVDAIEEVGRFTRPIQFISRNYNENIVTGGAATMFFVNEFSCAVTCKHVIDLIGNRTNINQKYANWEETNLASSNKIFHLHSNPEYFMTAKDGL